MLRLSTNAARVAMPIVLPLVAVVCGDAADPARGGSALRLNHLQALGTHNSYHQLARSPADPALDYVHDPLPAQLDVGVRHFELDVHRDVAGAVVVYHIKTVDDATSCATWSDCLAQIRGWSDLHAHHHLLVVLVEPKDDLAQLAIAAGRDPATVGELPWAEHIADIDAAVRATWPDRLLTPAAVRGAAPTLRDAVVAGWPSIDDTRQHLACVLNDTGALRDDYRRSADPACFVMAEIADPDAAFVKADDPLDAARIADALAAGFIVRTRADGDTEVDPATTDAALTSGAQLVSTDYPVARDDGAHPGYRIPWPGTAEHPSRCNPVTAPPDCADADIE